jgi:RNA polymerase sigma factor (sigma-70 family)
VSRSGVDDGVMSQEGAEVTAVPLPIAASTVDSVDQLYRREFGGLLRLAYSMTNSESRSEEIVQDAFVKLQATSTTIANPPAYLRTSVVNACRSHHRHQEVVKRTPVERAVEYEAAHDELFDAVATLPWRQQAALAMRFHLDLPEDEIAAALGCRPATVRSLVARALASLRKEIER